MLDREIGGQVAYPFPLAWYSVKLDLLFSKKKLDLLFDVISCHMHLSRKIKKKTITKRKFQRSKDWGVYMLARSSGWAVVLLAKRVMKKDSASQLQKNKGMIHPP
jgi:hypothetical protein